MYLSKNTPTLSGLVTGSYNTLTATSLAVTGDASIGGNVSAASISGNCITSSLTSSATNVAASASALATVYGLANGAITTAGGVINGPLTVTGQLNASNLSVLGSYEFVRAYETHTSNLVIENAGTGPALKVTQTETGPFGAQPVAQFFNGAGEMALCIDNSGNVGVNKASASTELDVSGTVTATAFVGSGAGLTGLPSAGLPLTGGTLSGSLGVGATPLFSLDCVGTINARTNAQIGYVPFNGIWPNPTTTTYDPPFAFGANYAPYDATTAAMSYAATTFSGPSGADGAFYAGAINQTNYISTQTANEYITYNVPSNMSMAFLNFIAQPTAGSIKIYGVNGGTSTQLCAVNTITSTSTQCVLPVNVTGYAQVKIVCIGNLWEVVIGVGWTVAPLAVWKSTSVLDVNGTAVVQGNVGVGKAPSTYALDVSGGVNATGIVTTNLTVSAVTTFSLTLPTTGTTTPITIYTFSGAGAYLVTAYCTSAWGATSESFGASAIIMSNVWNGTIVLSSIATNTLTLSVSGMSLLASIASIGNLGAPYNTIPSVFSLSMIKLG